MAIPLKTLIAKLNNTCRQAAERAANLCMSRGHYEVDLEHLFLALLEQANCDVGVVLRHSDIDPMALEADLNAELRGFKDGNSRTPVFSPHLSSLFEHAWLIASLDTQTTRIRSGHLLLALLTEPDLAQLARRGSTRFEQVKLDALKHDFDGITAGSSEAAQSVGFGDDTATAGTAKGAAALSQSPALDQYTTNLTERAREGHVDPVIGRDGEIRQMIDILTRRRQNNPILTGEAGVGKTAVVEGLALRIVAGDVPPSLANVTLRVLDMGLLQAGASVKGEFENRLKNVIDEVKRSPSPIILFIDEAHTMIGAGGQAGQNDAANLLKPALARGELRTIAATTWSEYKKYFEKDAALARRFQVVKVEEPDEALAASMLRGIAALMEKHFSVRVLDEAITAAVRLSHRYISGRQLPDKAVSVLDTACARVALGHSTTPALIDDTRQRLIRLETEQGALKRDAAAAGGHEARLSELDGEIAADRTLLDQAEQRLEQERELTREIQLLRQGLEQESAQEAEKDGGQAAPAASESAAVPSARRNAGNGGNGGNGGNAGKAASLSPRQQELVDLQAKLRDLQGESPLVPVCVDAQVVAEIVAAWTGIPLGRMVSDEVRTVLDLKETLAQRVIGQDHALDAIAQRVRTSRAGLEDPDKPKGVFLFVGPSGVGKTETALAVADILYGGERKLITINMSEYQEAHSVSGLKGSPPGYVGYGEGGVLTEAVRRQPYSVVLLDEIEKAHPDVLELFFQVFDKGFMDDAEGREIDFRNTLIILTSNVGSSTIMQACLNKDGEEKPDPDTLHEALLPALYKAFKPAFLGRMKTVAYYPVDDDALARIITLKLQRIAARVLGNHRAVFEWDDALVEAVLARCTEVDTGARNVDHILNGTLLPEIAEQVLARMAEGDAISRIRASASENGDFSFQVQ